MAWLRFASFPLKSESLTFSLLGLGTLADPTVFWFQKTWRMQAITFLHKFVHQKYPRKSCRMRQCPIGKNVILNDFGIT
jgi:hypothetical protein